MGIISFLINCHEQTKVIIKPYNLIDPHSLAPTSASNRRSITLISLHKAATSYFSSTVLKQVTEMVNIDYETLHYQNGDKYAPIVKSEGYIYGVIRLHDDDHPVKLLTSAIINKGQLNGLNLVILIRDPRDIIVSMYYSFGFSHGFSEDEATRKHQLKRRETIQSMSIDEYAVFVLPQLKKKLNCLIKLSGRYNRLSILKYDEMIMDFRPFFRKLQRAIPISDAFEPTMYADTRPQPIENIGSHRRSGEVGGHITKLKWKTIDRINDEIRNELRYFDYD